ncbi:MAG: stage II sporulation protein M [Nanoarchaeota archaeon]
MKRKKKRQQQEKGSYGKCWEYLKESRIYFLIVVLLFLASFIVGCAFPVFFNEAIEEFMRNVLSETETMNFLQLFLFILQNNLSTAFTGMVFGLVLGVFPILISLLNGYVLGYVSGEVVMIAGLSSLLRLLPHGIFELPALIISLGLGIKLGSFIFVKNKKRQLVHDLKNSFRIFLLVIIPLLFVAALIEAGLIMMLG